MNTSGTTPQNPGASEGLPEDAATYAQGGLVDAHANDQFNAAVEQRLTDGQDSGSGSDTQTETEDDKTDLPVLEEEDASPVRPQNS